jgi:hypothetical protein
MQQYQKIDRMNKTVQKKDKREKQAQKRENWESGIYKNWENYEN